MDWVGLVLAEVEGFFLGQAIRHACTVIIRRKGATKTVSEPFVLQGRGLGLNLAA
jgi:hypothetical protein